MRKSKTKQKKHRHLGLIIGGSLFCLLTLGLLVGFLYAKPYLDQLEEYRSRAVAIARTSRVEDFCAQETSLVYAADGSLLSSLKDVKDVYYLNYKDIPQAAIDCMIVTEDRKFWSHPGYDLKANAVAVYSYLKNQGVYRGGSTITQQLARNIYLTREVTLERKITELFLAAELEKLYSKEEILEFYLNNIYFANGYYGLQAAAAGYFNKTASALSLSETAFLCAIPNNPTKYDPVTSYENTIERRDRVLLQLKECGEITEAEYQEAICEEITLNRPKKEKQDYAETYSYYCAIRALMQSRGFVFQSVFESEEEEAEYEELYYEMYYAVQRSLFTEGYRIYTSIDPSLQAQLQQTLDNELAGFTEVSEDCVYELQGSAACIDNENGRVVAIIGGRTQEFAGYTLNRAYQSVRQAGSAIKPLLIYTPLFERGWLPEDMVLDEYFEGGPKNSGNAYSGEITVRKAVEQSSNVVAWKLFLELGIENGLQYLLNMNFSRIVDSDYVPAVSLGGFTYGVSAVEMASGFATLANDGIYREPSCIVMITDAKGRVLVGEEREGKRIYATNAARMMTDVLEGVMTKGTGRKLQLTNAIAAGKTGTATNRKDGWFVGYTAYYTTSVWVGCDYPKKVDDLAGNTYPGRIWQSYMDTIHEGLPLVEFAEYTVKPKQEPADDESDVQYNAFGEPIDPETGLPYGAVIDPERGVVYVPENEAEGEETEEGGAESGTPVNGGNQGADEPDAAQNNGESSEVDREKDTVYDTEGGELNNAEPSPTPTPDPRDAWFDSMYNQNRN